MASKMPSDIGTLPREWYHVSGRVAVEEQMHDVARSAAVDADLKLRGSDIGVARSCPCHNPLGRKGLLRPLARPVCAVVNQLHPGWHTGSDGCLRVESGWWETRRIVSLGTARG